MSVNEHVHATAQRYAKQAGLAPIREQGRVTPDAEALGAIADAYDDARDDASNEATREAYAYFRGEVAAQYDALYLAGYTFEPWTQAGQPYANSEEMRADVRDNKHLFYFRTSEGTPTHALMPDTYNDMFRCVHDVFGHAQFGNQFGPKGEFNAWLDHLQMFSAQALPALTTETLAQNAWFNFSRENSGLPVTLRKFATQKATLLDPSLYATLVTTQEDAA